MAEALIAVDPFSPTETELNPGHDWKNPDYASVIRARATRLQWLRDKDEGPARVAGLKAMYREQPWRMVNDWGVTYDPREAAEGRMSRIPFLLFPRQVEFLQWMHESIREGRSGLCEKSREVGVSWLVVGYAACMFLLTKGFVTGIGSRKEEYVDKVGDDKALFERIRNFLQYVPRDFWPKGFDLDGHSAHMRIWSPENDSSIVGEAGDNIGRGARTSVYVVDEAAFVAHQSFVDRSLSATTRCRIDVSSVNGPNEFYQKRQRWDKTNRVFIFDWRDDPRKDEAWYQDRCENLDEVTVAQEIDRDYMASQANQFLPGKWLAAAVDAHEKLGFRPEGIRVTGFDPADTGDARATVSRWGSVIFQADQLLQGDIADAIPWAGEIADQCRADILRYDAAGMGGPSMRLGLARLGAGRYRLQAYNGGGSVEDPEAKYGGPMLRDELPGDTDHLQTNRQKFANLSAQAWTAFRDRLEATYAAVTRAGKGQIINVDPESLISISSKCNELTQLLAELSRPQRKFTANGKIRVESKEEAKARGIASWNLADAAIMAIATRRPTAADILLPQVAPRRMRDPGAGY